MLSYRPSYLGKVLVLSSKPHSFLPSDPLNKRMAYRSTFSSSYFLYFLKFSAINKWYFQQPNQNMATLHSEVFADYSDSGPAALFALAVPPVYMYLCVSVCSACQLCQALCNPMNCTRQPLCPRAFPGRIRAQVTTSPPGDIPDPGRRPAYSALQADSLPLSHGGSQHMHLILYKLLISSLKAFLPIRIFLIFHLCVYPATHIFTFKLSFWKAGNVFTFYFTHSASNVTEHISKQQQLPVRFLSSLKLEAVSRKRNILLSSSVTLKPRKRTGSMNTVIPEIPLFFYPADWIHK